MVGQAPGAIRPRQAGPGELGEELSVYGLSDEDLALQARAATFAEELFPFEVEAEMADGELPPDVVAGHAKRARGRGRRPPTSPRNPAGEGEGCYAITGGGAGPAVAALGAPARRDGDEYVLNGVKWHVTSYNSADFAFFQGVLDGGPNAGEHAMFLVDLPSPGVMVVRTPAYSHTISHHHPIVAFTDVRVPAAHLIGAEGDGMSFAYEWFRFERLMVAARCLGAAQRLTAEMATFATQRQVQGRPISEFGTVAAMLADSLTELFAARSLVYETARGIDRGIDVKIAHAQCSMAKLYASETAGRGAA